MTESKDDFITKYLQRINDLDNPLPPDSPIFLAGRCVEAGARDCVVREEERKKVRLSPGLTTEQKERLSAEYYRCVESPATTTLDTFPGHIVTEVLEGKGWIVPNLLSEAECEELIELGEDWGISDSNTRVGEGEVRLRTSNRTNNYCNEELTVRLNQRLPEDLLKAVEASSPQTSVRGLHPNWRIGRYQAGQTFPAHQDQADYVTVSHPERGRQRYTSSHTLLINLRQPGRDFQGGATRFFMEGEAEAHVGSGLV